jgi:multidrug resistance efflux pump
MEESLDQGAPIAYPEVSGIRALPIHRQWSVGTGGTHVLSLPLIDSDTPVGIISLRRTATLPLTREIIEKYNNSILQFGPLLSLIDRANQPFSRHLKNATTEWLNARRSRLHVTAAIVFSLLVAWFCCGEIVYRPLCDSVVVPAELRNMTAPFEARLDGIYTQAGDHVKAGDVLIEFDTTHLRLELETIRAEVAKTEVDERAAIKAGDATAAALHRASIRVLTARQASFEGRIESAKLLAPSDGMIIQSGFDKRLGQVFSQGDPVLQFAPHDGWMLNIHVPENAAIYVEPDQVGVFSSAARPRDKVAFHIGQIDGSAGVIDESNVFVARANLQGSPTWMRSGMRGIARVTTIPKPVWWVAMHKFIDWTRLRFLV